MTGTRSIALAFAALAACTSRAETPPTDSATSATRAAAADDTVRVGRVMRGLRPPVEVDGRPASRWTLAERMAHYKVPGVSIGVIEGGRIAWARGIGAKEAGKSDSVGLTTLFQAASISKPVAATAMLRLVERGTLNLDTNVNKYLTSWKVPDNQVHRDREGDASPHREPHSGPNGARLPGLCTDRAGAHRRTGARRREAGEHAAVRVDTTPGSIERYSGGGTTVMQQLLVDVTGKPFPALMQELVLGPAGMTHSTYEQPFPAARSGEAAHAHGEDGKLVPGGWHV